MWKLDSFKINVYLRHKLRNFFSKKLLYKGIKFLNNYFKTSQINRNGYLHLEMHRTTRDSKFYYLEFHDKTIRYYLADE